MTETVLVCGAGMVGTAIALELQRRGVTVTLLDRQEPGLETSHGNAGIITRTSLVPINNPMLWQQLLKLMLNQSASMRYQLGFMLKNMGWATRFLLRARPAAGSGERVGEVTKLSRPIYDVSAGYVLAPMRGGYKLCTGVELADINDEKNFVQLDMSEASARQALRLGERQFDEPWMGCRPTMPDCRPVIGRAPGQKDLFFAFGHQHIGFNSGPGTAKLLADQIEGRDNKLQSEPFRPERFIHPI